MDEHKKVKTGKIAQLLFAAIAMTPLFLALLGTSSVPVGRPLERTKELPALAFRQYSVNMREQQATARIVAPFAFWNRSEKPLEITKLEPSCGCLGPKLLGNRKEYPPKAQGIFEVQVETANETPGSHLYSVKVHYRVDGQNFEEIVTFRCQIPERTVSLNPPELYFYQLSDLAMSGEVQVKDHRDKQLTIQNATTSSPYLKVSVGDRKHDEDGTTSTPVQVEVTGAIPAGSHPTFVQIHTNDEDFPLLRVPVFLQGKPKISGLTSETAIDQKAGERRNIESSASSEQP
ncbi:DUF1573 domain-containing protein [Planctomicrobium sp. SH668]|uniref:DUF1573 domain-containing protein n=1 Tax=Planctomicrobium sp. SH668 TaxID=3448126 RepID=UPI003F5B55B1